MPIDCVTGKIGAGKTYHVVSTFVVRALRDRRKIITNIEGLQPRELSLVSGVPMCDIDIELLENKTEWEKLLKLPEHDKEYTSPHLQRLKGCTCIIDEAQLIWFSRDFKNTSFEFIYFLTKSRHMDIDLVFVSQDIQNLDAAIRRLGNYFWHVYSKKTLGLKLYRDRYGVELRYTGEPDSPVFESEGYRYEQKFFRCYTSALDLTHQSKRSFPVPGVFKLAFAFIILLAFLVPKLYRQNMRIFSGKEKLAAIHANNPVKTAPALLPGIKPPSDVKIDAAPNLAGVLMGSEPNASTEIAAVSADLPGVSGSQGLHSSHAAKVGANRVCTRKPTGGCLEYRGKKECSWQDKEVCE